MSKTVKNCFDSKLTFVKMIEAEKRARDGKGLKPEVITFGIDLETNIARIVKEIKNNTYKFGTYREFVIYEPKERIIKSLPYRDRVVHQWYIEEFIKPYFMSRFIPTTYACIEERGTHNAVYMAQKIMRRCQRKYGDYYILKCDIKKYFYNINKDKLLDILSKYISDKKIINFTKVILDDGSSIGIPIGNYTSQFYANIYLNELDHYIYDELNIKDYIRYMDDFILFVKTKEEAKILLDKINKYVNNNLYLELNHKSKYFPNYLGLDFCGYKIFEDHKLLRKRFKKKLNKKLKLWFYLKENKCLDKDRVRRSYASTKAHASHCCSKKYFKKQDDKYLDLMS